MLSNKIPRPIDGRYANSETPSNSQRSKTAVVLYERSTGSYHTCISGEMH